MPPSETDEPETPTEEFMKLDYKKFMKTTGTSTKSESRKIHIEDWLSVKKLEDKYQ